jgi:hypothetical protein
MTAKMVLVNIMLLVVTVARGLYNSKSGTRSTAGTRWYPRSAQGLMTRSAGMSRDGSWNLIDQYKTAIMTSRGVARSDMVSLVLEKPSCLVRSVMRPRVVVMRDKVRPTTVRSWKYHPKESEYAESHVVKR